MTHAFHTGRYSGANTVPNTASRQAPAAALVLHHAPARTLAPMFAQLDAHPAERAIGEIRLIPITVTDFYARGNGLPDLQPLGRPAHACGDTPARPEHVCARAAVGVPAAGAGLQEVRGSAGGRRRGARGVARKEVS